MDIDVSLVEECRRLAKQCKMTDLIEELENKCKQVYEFGKIVLMINNHIPKLIFFTNWSPLSFFSTVVCQNVFFLELGLTFFLHVFLFLFSYFLHTEVSNKPGICVKVLSLEPHSCRLQEEMAQLADCALPTELRVRT